MTIEDFKDEKLVMFNVDSVQNELLKNRFDGLNISSRMPRAAAVSILHVINQVFHAINSSGVFQCAHRIIVTVVIGNI